MKQRLKPDKKKHIFGFFKFNKVFDVCWTNFKTNQNLPYKISHQFIETSTLFIG